MASQFSFRIVETNPNKNYEIFLRDQDALTEEPIFYLERDSGHPYEWFLFSRDDKIITQDQYRHDILSSVTSGKYDQYV